uniref:DNA terminal protein n=1 Tax=Podoviridae sp. ctnWS46 TaxID=2827747 RepID=A0A8S5SZJ4_9CAUD|nr:MAG TPA: DNA terminal protein [Podoviridae sp. ctnWS46]
MRKSSKDVKRLRNAIASAKRTATRAQNLGQDVIFNDIRSIKDFNDRKEFNKYLKSIERFNKENRYIENQYGVVFNRNKLEKANKLIDKQNKQRKQLSKSVGLVKLNETKGGIITPISVKNARSTLKDDRGGFFESVHHVNINSYRYPKQLDKRIESLKRNTKKENQKIKNLRSNYKTAIEEQIRGGNITKKEGKQLIKDIKSLSDKELIQWFYQERKAVAVFNYIDMSREYTQNQIFVNEQLSKNIKSDMSDISDSLAVFTGRAYVSGGVVKYK